METEKFHIVPSDLYNKAIEIMTDASKALNHAKILLREASETTWSTETKAKIKEFLGEE